MATPAPEEPLRLPLKEDKPTRNDIEAQLTDVMGSTSSARVRRRQSLLGLIPVISNGSRATMKIGFEQIGKVDAHFNETSVSVYDEMTYLPEFVLTWRAIFADYHTIWSSRNLWKTVGHLNLISVIVAIIIVLVVPDPATLRISIFYELSRFLNVFCGLTLGFFLRTSVQRWHSCCQGFLELCDAIRNLQMQLQSLGVPQDRCDLCIRYGLISGWLLMTHLESEMNTPGGEKVPDAIWKDLTAPSDDTQLGSQAYLLPCEVPTLRSVQDPAAGTWTWISSLVGRMAQDQQIPKMASPTYGRIMNLAQDAHNGIRHVRSAISIRTPFVYVQLLTSICHVNNFMNAINLGCVVGIAISGALIRSHLHYFEHKVRSNENERDVQFLVVTVIISFVGPVLFQALMEIAVSLAQPFATKFGQIPIARLLLMLEEDLDDGNAMSKLLPKWERPQFNRPAPPPK